VRPKLGVREGGGNIRIDRGLQLVAKRFDAYRRIGGALQALPNYAVAGDFVPKSREATIATAAAGSSAASSLTIVAEVPTQIGVLSRHQTVAKPSDEHRNIGALPPPIGVQFVENDKVEILCVADNGLIEGFCLVISSSSIMKLVSRMSG